MKILVTGIGGFIAPHVARRFVADGHEVIGVDDFSSGHRSNVPHEVELIEADLAAPSTRKKLPSKCDYVLHLAGQSSGEISFDDPVKDLEKNTVSTLELVRYASGSGVSRIVYASSMSVYGAVDDAPVSEDLRCAPLSCYGVGKLSAEHYLRVYASAVPFVALRMFNVYGQGQDLSNLRQGMVSIFLAQALSGGRVHVRGSLQRFRDFIHVRDVAEAWYAATFSDSAVNRCINVGSGVRTTIEELLSVMQRSIPEMSWYSEGNTRGDQLGVYADIKRLAELLGPHEVTALEPGITEFATWARSRLSA